MKLALPHEANRLPVAHKRFYSTLRYSATILPSFTVDRTTSHTPTHLPQYWQTRGRSVIDRSSRAVYSILSDFEDIGLSHGGLCISGDLRISCARCASIAGLRRGKSALKQHNVARSAACPSGQQYLLIEYDACGRRHMGHRKGYLPSPESCRAKFCDYAI